MLMDPNGSSPPTTLRRWTPATTSPRPTGRAETSGGGIPLSEQALTDSERVLGHPPRHAGRPQLHRRRQYKGGSGSQSTPGAISKRGYDGDKAASQRHLVLPSFAWCSNQALGRRYV